MNTLVFYIIVQLLSMLLLFLGVKSNNKLNKKYLIFLSALILILVIGFRGLNTGADTRSYANVLYRYISNNITIADKKWIGNGYFLLFFLMKYTFGYNYIVFNLVIGSLTIYFIYKFILENSKKPVMSLFLFFSTCLFLQCLNQARQMLAIVMVLYSFKYIKKNDIFKYFCVIILASFIHNSALIMIPFYFLRKLKLNYKTYFGYFIIAVIFIFGFGLIKNILLMTSYGKIYIANNYMIDSQKSSYINLIIRFLLLIFVFIFKKSSLENDENNSYLYHMSILTLLTQLITLKMYIFGRITTYFFAYYIILIPNILENIKNNVNKKFYSTIVILLFIAYFFVYYKFVSQSAEYDIYKFFWNK